MERLLDKYQPRRFSTYIGIERLMPVIESIVHNQLWHGILVTGENGMGKSTLARILLSRLTCERPDGVEPCLECPSCNQFDPEKRHTYGERNVKSGACLTRSWVESLEYELVANSMFFFPRHIWIDDVDAAQEGVLDALLLQIDRHSTSPMFFTATHLEKLPAPFIQRMKVLVLRKLTSKELSPFVRSVCANEEIQIVEPQAVDEVIRLANRNYRNILNTLEAVRDYDLPLSLASLTEEHVLDNLGLQVGEKRYVFVNKVSSVR